jgi:hypothetical protein
MVPPHSVETARLIFIWFPVSEHQYQPGPLKVIVQNSRNWHNATMLPILRCPSSTRRVWCCYHTTYHPTTTTWLFCRRFAPNIVWRGPTKCQKPAVWKRRYWRNLLNGRTISAELLSFSFGFLLSHHLFDLAITVTVNAREHIMSK